MYGSGRAHAREAVVRDIAIISLDIGVTVLAIHIGRRTTTYSRTLR
jgi:hypothetical protein